jgi:large subunit ribosomal protein L6
MILFSQTAFSRDCSDGQKRIPSQECNAEDLNLCRTLTANMINGVSTGFKKDLELIGVGYRASVQGQTLTMNLGYSHPVVMTIPEGITVKVESNTRMNISGRDKELVGQFAASIRKWRPPEPYKGKGIKFQGEVIRRKAGKAGKKK